MRSSLFLMAVFGCSLAQAAIPGNKRTIFTTGEKVYPIRYQLGQSTVLDLGVKPEVVICGNKNYFNIEKLKNGITIQPLSNFSTNLTVLSGQKRFLFYLVPSGGQSPDGFVDVRWVPANEKKLASHDPQKADTQLELNQKVKLGSELEVDLVRVKISHDGSRRIFDLLIRNRSQKKIELKAVSIAVYEGNQIVKNQALAWEKEVLDKNTTVTGRMIVTKFKGRTLALLVNFGGKSIKLNVKGSRN